MKFPDFPHAASASSREIRVFCGDFDESGQRIPKYSGPRYLDSSLSSEWGAGNGGPSALEIGGGGAETTVITNGDAITNVWITHENNPIFETSGPFLESVNILSTLTLTPDPFGGAATTLTFPVTFYETPNAANPCADGTANNQGVNVNGCADIFVIDQDTLDVMFEYEGYWYGLSFFGGILAAGIAPESDISASALGLTPGLDVLSDAACSSVATATGNIVPSGCRGWLTPEEQTTTFLFATSILALDPSPVPEPATIALMGFGLGMLGMMYRRRDRFSV
nr:THxN family PEP-CTERM protein [Ectothiorhodospira lacustris]